MSFTATNLASGEHNLYAYFKGGDLISSAAAFEIRSEPELAPQKPRNLSAPVGSIQIGKEQIFRASALGCDNPCQVPVKFLWQVEHRRADGTLVGQVYNQVHTSGTQDRAPYIHDANIPIPADIPCGDKIVVKYKAFTGASADEAPWSVSLQEEAWRAPEVKVLGLTLSTDKRYPIHGTDCEIDNPAELRLSSCGCRVVGQAPQNLDIAWTVSGKKPEFTVEPSGTPTPGAACHAEQVFLVTYPTATPGPGVVWAEGQVEPQVTDVRNKKATDWPVALDTGSALAGSVSIDGGVELKIENRAAGAMAPTALTILVASPSPTPIPFNFRTLSSGDAALHFSAQGGCYEDFPGPPDSRDVLGQPVQHWYSVPDGSVVDQGAMRVPVNLCQTNTLAIALAPKRIKVWGKVIFSGKVNDQLPIVPVVTPRPSGTVTPSVTPTCVAYDPDQLATGQSICGAKVTVRLGDQTSTTYSGVDGYYELEIQPPTVGEQTLSLRWEKEGFVPKDFGLAVQAASCDQPESNFLGMLLAPKDDCKNLIKNPINARSGERHLEVQDLSLPGRAGHNLTFERRYSTFRIEQEGPFGWGWTHNWDIRLKASPEGGYLLHFNDGQWHWLVDPENDGQYKGVNGFFYTLGQESGSWVLKDTQGLRWVFGPDLRLDRHEDRFGNAIQLRYEGALLSELQDSAGRRVELDYHPQTGRIRSLLDPAGRKHFYFYGTGQETGCLTKVLGPGSGDSQESYGGQVNQYKAEYSYDAQHRILTKKDVRQTEGYHWVRYTYDAAGRSNGIYRLPADTLITSVTYNTGLEGRDTEYTENGYTRSALFDEFGRPAGVKQGDSIERTQWDPFNQGQSEVEDRAHRKTYYTYYRNESGYVGRNRGEVKDIVSPGELKTEFKYDDYGFGIVKWRKETDLGSGDSRIYQATVDAQGRVTQTNDNGRVTDYIFDPNGYGEWTSKTGPDQQTWTRTFWPSGQVHKLSNLSTGQVLTHVYDNLGRLTSIHDNHRNLLTSYLLDDAGLPYKTTFSDSQGTSFIEAAYDHAGRVWKRIDERQKVTHTYYLNDQSGRIDYETGPGNAYTRTYSYDSNNNVGSVTLSGSDGDTGSYSQVQGSTYVPPSCCAASGQIKTRTVEGAQAAEGESEQTLTTTYDYYSDGALKSVEEPEPGRKTEHKYDPAGRLGESILGTGADTRTFTYVYNAFGERTKLRDGKLQWTEFEFNQFGQMTGEQPPSPSQALAWDYHTDGRLNYRTDRLGRVLDYQYDEQLRLDKEVFANGGSGTQEIQYGYGSPGGGPQSLGWVQDASGRVEFDYGHRGRVKQQFWPQRQRRLDYTYIATGQPQTLTLSDLTGQHAPVQQTSTYDDLGRMDSLTDWGGNKLVYHYDAASQLRRVEFHAKQAGGSLKRIATGRMKYDRAGRILSLVYRKGSAELGPLLARVDYRYDKSGNRTQRKTLGSQGDYSYNTLNEIKTDANTADLRGSQIFNYDLAGNRSSQVLGVDTQAYTISNDLNRLDGVSGPQGNWSYGHDLEGNRNLKQLGSEQTTYQWDGKNRLTQVQITGGVTVNYVYDYTNHRVRRIQGSETRDYLYSGNQVIEEQLNGQRIALMSWGAQGLATRRGTAGETGFYLWDGLGSVVATIDEKADIVQSYEYSAFGENLAGKDAVNQFQFVGGYGGQTDMDTGLVYFWNRWYDPQVGRWVSEDPIRQAGGDENLFRYVANNPVLFVDSEGLAIWKGAATYYNLVGNERADQQMFDPNIMAAAMTKEKVPRLGTTVSVCYLKKGKKIDVVVNDRGPFKRGSDGKAIRPLQPSPEGVIDLTPAAFKALVGSLDLGKVQVEVTVP